MKRTWVTAKQLAELFGVDQETVYRAYRTGKIPGSQMGWNIRFDLDEVHRVMRKRAEAMPNSQCAKHRATGGGSRRRAAHKRSSSVKRGPLIADASLTTFAIAGAQLTPWSGIA